MKGRPYTFNEYHIGYSSEVKTLTREELELTGYQSDYLQMFTILKETGWKLEGGKWHSPHTKAKFRKINEAYGSQKLWEKIG